MLDQPPILLLDTGIGNIQSVANVLEHVGAPFHIASDVESITLAKKIIFPGVGTYGNAMERINKKGLVEPLKKAMLKDKIPCLGICVGMQVLSDLGYEFGEHLGLGIIPGNVVKIEVTDSKLRLPHVGWNNVEFRSTSPLFKGAQQNSSFYFLHSYHFMPAHSEYISCTTQYGQPIAAAIEKDNVFGVQFHPEKSQSVGIQVMRNFVGL